ncbi:DUF7563 family protein [Halopenitus persicus]
MTRLDTEPADRRRYLNCGSHVSREFRRIHGDTNGRIHRCPSCDSHRRIFKGSAAGQEVPTPDPKVAPGRHGDRPAGWRE